MQSGSFSVSDIKTGKIWLKGQFAPKSKVLDLDGFGFE